MRELDLHVEACAECRQLVDGAAHVFAALDDFASPMCRRTLTRSSTRALRRRGPRSGSRWLPVTPIVWWKPAVPVALAALALFGLFVVRTSNPGSAQQQPVIGKADVEQVEQAVDDMELLAPRPLLRPLPR